ncbi:MAG: AMP-binding protein [Bacteroidales bacterium]|jgi:long-chain acyl-CoA synthetase|nr:AMP-binding protein [Bacteroidales bacterium]
MINKNLIELFHDSFEKYWDYNMYTDYGKKCIMKYSDVARDIAFLHAYFDEVGLQTGDKVSLIGRNSTNWAISYLATVSYGAVIVPILADFKPQDIHHVINHSDSVLLLSDESIWEGLDEMQIEEVRAIISLQTFDLLVASPTFDIEKVKKDFVMKYPTFTRADCQFKVVDNKELMVLNYTSGTTGFSKGVMIPANSLAGNVIYASERIPLDEGTKMVSFLPLAHTYGCAFDFLLPVVKGVHVHFITRLPSPKILIKAFQEVKPQVILSVPMVLEKIFKKQIMPLLKKRSMRIMMNIPIVNERIAAKIREKLLSSFGGNINEIILGGAAIGKDAEDFLTKIKFPFTLGYGMTECGPLISYENAELTRPYSCGHILEGIMELKIDSPKPYEVPGEILVRGENLMYGYYKNKEATDDAIDKEGWLHTGDMGITDADDFVYIKGRYKSMLLSSNGQNIYPEEIEAKLNNLSFVSESLVLQNEKNLLVALIVPDVEEMDMKGVKEEELSAMMDENIKELNKIVGTYEKIARFKIYPQEFEKTPKKSIKRYLYKDEA